MQVGMEIKSKNTAQVSSDALRKVYTEGSVWYDGISSSPGEEEGLEEIIKECKREKIPFSRCIKIEQDRYIDQIQWTDDYSNEVVPMIADLAGFNGQRVPPAHKMYNACASYVILEDEFFRPFKEGVKNDMSRAWREY